MKHVMAASSVWDNPELRCVGWGGVGRGCGVPGVAGVGWADPRKAVNGYNTGILKYTQLGHISVAVTDLRVMQERFLAQSAMQTICSSHSDAKYTYHIHVVR